MKLALTALCFIAACAAFDGAKADPYRWCAHYGGFSGAGGNNCWFMTLEQCRAAISGVGGTCAPNPFYDGVPIDGPRAKRRARPRQ
jgi:hypothetical protein